MADYPTWVLKYKEKGTYINRVKEKYYLYAAHSERVPGTKKVKRICDGYLGRITEEDGLIAPKDKVTGTVFVYEYGLSNLILSVCSNIHKGFRKTFTKNGDYVMAASILMFLYGNYDESLFCHSFLSVKFPEIDFSSTPTEAQLNGIDRGFRMIKDTMLKTFGGDLSDVIIQFGLLYKVKINGSLYTTETNKLTEFFIHKYKLPLED